MISLLHPSRSRPKQAHIAAMHWLQNAGCDVEYILSLDKSDPLHYQYAPGFPPNGKVVTYNNNSAIEAINNAARHSTGDVIVVMSDDFQCFTNWGVRVQKLLSGKADWILKTQDGIQDWVITLPIMDRIYYERFGYIYHPAYAHCFCDTELTCVAELTGRKEVSEMMFRHLNEGATKIVDDLSKRNDATFEDGRRVFIERKKKYFDLPEINGRMSMNVYTHMC